MGLNHPLRFSPPHNFHGAQNKKKTRLGKHKKYVRLSQCWSTEAHTYPQSKLRWTKHKEVSINNVCFGFVSTRGLSRTISSEKAARSEIVAYEYVEPVEEANQEDKDTNPSE